MNQVKGDCQKCGQHMSFDPNNAGAEINCPHCGLITKLLTPSMVAATNPPQPTANIPAPSPIPPAPAPTAPLTTTNRLKVLRSQTCYPVLRIVIAIAALMSGLGAVFAVTPFIAAVAGEFHWLMIIPSALASIVWALFIHQSASVLVDIADATVQMNAKT